MRAPAWSAIAVVLALVPVGQAGTPDRPELADRPYDWTPFVPTPSTDAADLWAGWIWGETPASLNVSLRVARIASDTRATYDFGWIQSLSGMKSVGWGVRAVLDGGDEPSRFEVTSGDPLDPVESWPRVSIPTLGSIKAGSPGTLNWYVPRVGGFGVLESSFDSFRARASSPIPVGGNVEDWGMNTTNRFWVGEASLRTLPTFVVPDRGPDVGEPVSMGQGAWDVKAFWVDFDDAHVTLTTRVANLTADSLGACAPARRSDGQRPGADVTYRILLKQTQSSGFGKQVVSYGQWAGLARVLNRTQSSEVLGPLGADSAHFPGTYSVVEGSPGYVRIVGNRSDWRGTTAVGTISVLVQAECHKDGQSDYLSLNHDSDGIPGPSAAWLAASGLLLAAWRRRWAP